VSANGDKAGAPRQSAADARAEAQARATARRAERAVVIDREFADGVPGRAILVAAQASTAVFVVATVVAAAVDTRPLRLATALVDVVLFVVGCALFLVALYDGAQRSREAEMTMSGWWFLTDAAPPAVRRTLLGALAVQTVTAFAGAAARPFTSLAFGILVPTLGVALAGLWGARHGSFPERRVVAAPPPARRRRR